MRRLYFLISITAVFLIILCNSAWAVQSVDWAKAEPDGTFVNTPTTVTIKAQIGLDPNLILSSANLIQYDGTYKPVANLGRLYDDGTHGDALPGDNIFTTQVAINKSAPTTINYKVSVAYKGTLKRVTSDFFSIDVVTLPSEADVNNILSVNQQASDNLETWSQQYGNNQAFIMLVNYLLSQPTVQNAGISQYGNGVWVIYKDGLEGFFGMNPPDTWGYPSSNKGIVFSPFSNFADPELIPFYNRLENDTCVSPEPIKRDSAVTVDFLKTLSQYGVISMATHGNVDGNGNAYFSSGEKGTTFLGIPTSHFIDWWMKRIFIGNGNYWQIRPSFIRHYAQGNKYPGSIIYLSVCHSLDNNTLSSAFIDNGAKTVFGWQHSVSMAFSRQTKENLLVQMIDNNRTTGEAYNNVPHVDPWSTPNANLLMAGAGDMELPVNLITNGSFETGNFNGWVTGSQTGCQFPQYAGPIGYSAVVTGNATDGTNSSRIGRFDQLYAGGLMGPPDPGKEPCGYDYIYQDIQLPQFSSLTLTFSYNVQSFDAGIWDWLDVSIKDPATGTNLATVVSAVGKPGSQYGVYWNGGWQNVTFNLAPWAGQKIRLWFGNHQDGWGDQTATWIDNVSIACH
jgi:hypothetical protein